MVPRTATTLLMQSSSDIAREVFLSFQRVPTTTAEWCQVVVITLVTTASAAGGAYTTGFIDPYRDYDPPKSWWEPWTALVFPGLVEEALWRSTLIPSLAASTSTEQIYKASMIVLVLHVLSHPFLSAAFYPTGGKRVLGDARFLALATIILGGATASYLVTGGSVWAAALTHAVPVALWRDFFGGKKTLLFGPTNRNRSRNNHPPSSSRPPQQTSTRQRTPPPQPQQQNSSSTTQSKKNN